MRVQACQLEREDKRVNFPAVVYLLCNPPISLTSMFYVKLLHRAILPLIWNNPASRMRRGEKISSDLFTFEAGGISVGTVNATAPLRCLIDRGCVKSDSLFCSTPRWPALPCLRCFEKQVVYPNTGLTLWDNTLLRWYESAPLWGQRLEAGVILASRWMLCRDGTAPLSSSSKFICMRGKETQLEREGQL